MWRWREGVDGRNVPGPWLHLRSDNDPGFSERVEVRTFYPVPSELQKRVEAAKAWLWLHLRGESGLDFIDGYEAARHAAEVLNGQKPSKRSLRDAARAVQAENDGQVAPALAEEEK